MQSHPPENRADVQDAYFWTAAALCRFHTPRSGGPFRLGRIPLPHGSGAHSVDPASINRAASGRFWKAAEGCRSPCADALMKPTSESLSLEETRYLKVAEGYCVSARAGGEQPEAKDQPQTRVNPIRPDSMTSRRTGGIGGGAKTPVRVPGEVRGASPAVSHNITRSVWTDGCCGVCGVGMVRRFHKLSQDRWPLRRGAARRQSPHSSEETGNDRGAKGDRKVKAI